MTIARDLTAAEIVALGEARLVRTYKRPPMVLSHGRGVQVWDTDGREYLDFAAGIAVNALGHADSGIAAVLAEQAAKLMHTSNLYHTLPQIELAEKLTAHSFADRVFFTNSGTEANEAAIKFARKYARVAHNTHEKTQIVCFDHAFHGRTIGSLALTPKEAYQAPFRPLMPDVIVLPFNDQAALAQITERACAVFIEPIQGEGGIHEATPEFLRALRERCDQVGALLVFDEVQCGLGRTGDLWAHQASGVLPDMMTLAKPLAGGLPIGALLATERVAAALSYGDHGSTFAGSPLITAVANHVFDRLSAAELLAQVRRVGGYLKARLQAINSAHIKEVRGRGLMLGVEFTSDLAAQVVEQGYAHGLLLVGSGSDVLRVIPPLIVTERQCDQFVERLTAILANL
ncbi:MAG: acetylornithine transaminase [Candidatus Thermofonsia Clade 1 bacterium]|jgi:predicted acetylornithine/succinylornithine family transaminase|uniref:Acetylornithine aminotransferase n=1 Tax=Candidatus Thermofonsia Clade 1 bacterium TaxID=2364210 RepID=A0A2M8PE76_9CHLR|nr:MAG: acetylornithine transaminase [Candidatus Thermofonsia Clade 1 bacterium]RMF52909.1 MAG: acetylornithine transaminase [Chloroflexota bacterium]